jgi:hypothetical protein
VLPGVFVLSCAAASAVYRSSRRWRVLALLALVPAAAAGIWINAVQGVFNSATAAWNASPSIDRFPGYAFDWQLPQFWATHARLADRDRRHAAWLRAPLEPNVDYTRQSTALEFLDWPGVERGDASGPGTRVGATPSIRFLVGDGTLHGAQRMMLTLCLGGGRPATGEVWLNGRRLAQLTIGGAEPAYHVLAVPRGLVRTIEYDVLESNVLEWRGALPAEGSPPRLSALRVHAGRRAS